MKNPLFTGHSLNKAEMKKITGGNGFCVPDDGSQPCLYPGATISCAEIPCCCDAYCSSEWSGTEFVYVCKSW